ncbi:MAG TPA: hypothetical protein VH639_18975 [Bryobacteraceae bacterium]|jgi:hypothetical protein
MKPTIIRGIANFAAVMAVVAVAGSGVVKAQYTTASAPTCYANGTQVSQQSGGCSDYLGVGLTPDPSGDWRAVSTCTNACTSTGMSAEVYFDCFGCSQYIPWVGQGSAGPVVGQVGNFYVLAVMDATKLGNNQISVSAIAGCGQSDFQGAPMSWLQAPC